MKKIDAAQLKEMRANRRPLLVNVLDEAKFVREHIPASINIPGGRKDFTEEVQRRLGGKDQPVVVYCASISCQASPQAARRLDEAGFEQVYDFEGGMEEWKQAGRPVEAGV